MSTKITQPYVWLPTKIAGCRLWLDASLPSNFVLGTAPNTDVLSWNDSSQYVNSLNLTPSAVPPQYNSNTKSVNFVNGSNNSLFFQDNSSTLNFNSDNHTLIAVTTPSDPTTDTNIFNFVKQDTYVAFPYGDRGAPYGYITSYGGPTLDYRNSTLTANLTGNQKNLIVADISSVTQNIYNNGTFMSGTNVSIIGQNIQTLYLGGINTAPDPWPIYTPSYLTGSLNEILYYDRSISTAERQQIEGYLAWKWNTQDYLPQNHPYKNFPPFQNNLPLPQALNAPIQLEKIPAPGNQFANVSNKIFLNKTLPLPSF